VNHFAAFRCESADPTANAERNLSGRTHYAAPDTRRYFRSRIVASGEACGGLLFLLIESMPMRHREDKRGFRYRVFDICGGVVDGKGITDPDCFHATRKGAERALRDALRDIDGIAATREALTSYEQWITGRIESARVRVDELERASIPAIAAGE